tara:strand:+ start:5265 stop:5708 length:444 start_codon:yes stop_codon:yes gene_type:complete
MDSNTNDMSKILINGFIQRILNNIEKNVNVFGLIPAITIVASTVLFQDSNDLDISNIEQNGNIIDLLDNLNEIPSTVEKNPQKNIDILITFEKIKQILELSIKNWIENGYTIADILNVFQSIKELMDDLSNNIDFNQNLRQLMYSSL